MLYLIITKKINCSFKKEIEQNFNFSVKYSQNGLFMIIVILLKELIFIESCQYRQKQTLLEVYYIYMHSKNALLLTQKRSSFLRKEEVVVGNVRAMTDKKKPRKMYIISCSLIFVDLQDHPTTPHNVHYTPLSSLLFREPIFTCLLRSAESNHTR